MAAGVAIAFLAIPVVGAQIDDASSVIASVRVLPLSDRASVVVEVEGEIEHIAISESTEPSVFAVTFGPIEGWVTPTTLEAVDTSRLVREVRVREHDESDGTTMALVEAVALEPVKGSVRTSGRYIYLDVAPVTP